MSGLYTLVLCLALYPLTCLGDSQGVCGDSITPGRNDTNNFVAYEARVREVAGTDVCDSVELRCNATIPESQLTDRTWFLSPVKNYVGIYYLNDYIELYNIQCPRNHLLHLVVQEIDADNTVPGFCTGGDFVRVDADGLVEIRMCQSQIDETLANSGLGRLINNSARIEFCTDADTSLPRRNGFVIRATCLNLLNWRCSGCVDYRFFQRWDPDFVDLINRPFPPPERVQVPHKRSTDVKPEVPRDMKDEMPQAPVKRMKRFRFRNLRIALAEDDTVTYNDNTIQVRRGILGDPDEPITDIFRLRTRNPLVGVRIFRRLATIDDDGEEFTPFEFTGEGVLHIHHDRAVLDWTVQNEQSFFLPSLEIMRVANRIYDYIYDNFVVPYPFIDEAQSPGGVFPLPGAEEAPFPLKRSNLVGVIFPQIDSESSQCRHVVRFNDAPQQDYQIPDSQRRFCEFFQFACDPTLRAACRALLSLDGLIRK